MSENVFVLVGDAATSKTTLGREIALHFSACLLDIDASTEPLVRAGLAAAGMDPDDRDSAKYKSLFRDAIHDTLFSSARMQHSSLPVVIVAPFTRERKSGARSFCQFLCQKLWGLSVSSSSSGTDVLSSTLRMKKSLTVIHLYCDAKVRLQRMLARNNPRDASKFVVLSDAQKDRISFDPHYEGDGDTPESIAALQKECVAVGAEALPGVNFDIRFVDVSALALDDLKNLAKEMLPR